MSGLVGYASSDDDDDVQPEKPAKIAKHEVKEGITTQSKPALTSHGQEIIPPLSRTETHDEPSANTISGPSIGPAAGPARTEVPGDASSLSADSAPFSPYTYERQRLQDLTMPTVPNFSIPDSPPLPAKNSEEAARLAATTKKFERFLELKKQGTHFNERLQNSSSLRNPGLLPKLMEFARIELADSYRSTLPPELGVPSVWPEEYYVEQLVRRNGKEEKRMMAERGKVDFVPATTKAAHRDAVETSARGFEDGKRSTVDR